jgi:hypothetical protein
MNRAMCYALTYGVLIELASGFVPVCAQSMQDVRACKTEADPARRLSCYDHAAGRVETASPPTAPAPASSIAPAGSAPAGTKGASDAAEFGVSGGPIDAKRQATATQQITAVVTALKFKPRGEFIVTLDSGEVWAQNEAVAYFPLNVGDKVQIIRAALGSYMLLAPSKRSAKVTRLR